MVRRAHGVDHQATRDPLCARHGQRECCEDPQDPEPGSGCQEVRDADHCTSEGKRDKGQEWEQADCPVRQRQDKARAQRQREAQAGKRRRVGWKVLPQQEDNGDCAGIGQEQ